MYDRQDNQGQVYLDPSQYGSSHEYEDRRQSSNRRLCLGLTACGVLSVACVVVCCVGAIAFALLSADEVVWFPDEDTQIARETVPQQLDSAGNPVPVSLELDSDGSVRLGFIGPRDDVPSNTLLQGIFEYNVDGLQPTITDDFDRDEQTVTLEPSGGNVLVIGTSINNWTVNVAREAPLFLDIDSNGVNLDFIGESANVRELVVDGGFDPVRLNLEGEFPQLARIEIDTSDAIVLLVGAGTTFPMLDEIIADTFDGDTTLDLRRATWTGANNVTIKIDSSNGSVELTLPEGVQYDIRADTSDGTITVDGQREGGQFMDTRTTGVTPRFIVEIEAGNGDVQILTQ
jgi:hypothetical protein